VNTLDLVVLVTAVSSVVGGWRLGLVARGLSWVGLAVGLVLAARFLPDIVRAAEPDQPMRALAIVIGVLVGGAFVGQAIGLAIGARFHRLLPPGPLRTVDRGLGAAAGALAVLVAFWALLPAMSEVSGWPARQARRSVVARAVHRWFPRPPDTVQALRRLVGRSQFPQVFGQFAPSQNAGPPPAAVPLAAPVVTRVTASTVKVTGVACHRIQDGSGFAAGSDVVVTNAHVVAGEGSTTVVRPDGHRLQAIVVLFDPDRDLAVLRVPGLGEAALGIATASPGAVGAVFGHPGGQDAVQVAPAAVKQEVEALGRDLYDSHPTRRQVFVLASDLHPGDSGGALVDRAGAVVGVAFAIAPDEPGTAYALTTAQPRPDLAAAGPGRVATGPCLND